jgi:Ser/Thr protein kinase RdoA (MazF antagonist)
MQAIHSVDVPSDLPEISTPQLLAGPRAFSPVGPLLEALEQARGLEHVEERVITAAERIIRETAYTLEPWDCPTLVHGDLTFENILWDGETITAVVDFEFARAGPPDLDLDVLLRFCAFPFLHVAEDYEHLTLASDYADVPWWLAAEYPALFDRPHEFDRVRIYSIAFDVRELVRFPPERKARELSQHHALNRLERTVEGQGYLDTLAAESWTEHAS